MKRIFLFISFSFSVLLAGPASADFYTGETRDVSICYYLSNIEDFPDRVFLLIDMESFKYQLIGQGDCFGGPDFNSPKIYSIQKDYFDSAIFQKGADGIKKYLNDSRADTDKVFYGGKEYKLVFSQWVPIDSPAKDLQKYIKIINLKNTGTFKYELERNTPTYNNSGIDNLLLHQAMSSVIYLGIAVLGLIGLLGVYWYRKKRIK